MKSYTFIPHVADTRMQVRGTTLEELFSAALEGMAELIKRGACAAGGASAESADGIDSSSQRGFLGGSSRALPDASRNGSAGANADIQKTITLESADSTTLLIDFLSEVLTYSHEQKAVFCRAEFSNLNNNALEARVFGSIVGEFDEDVKAVTYHEADVRKNENGEYETVVVFDI